MIACRALRPAISAAFVLVFGVLGLVRAWAADANEIVTAARLGVHDRETRFVLELTAKVPYTITAEADPDRITVTLPAMGWQHSQTAGKASSGLVSGFRYKPGHAGKAEVVLNLRGPAKVRSVSFIPPESGHDWRLVIDLAGAGKAEFQRMAEADAKSQPPAAAPKQEFPKPEPAKPEPPKIIAKAEPPPAPKPAAPQQKPPAPAPVAPPAAPPAMAPAAAKPQIVAEALSGPAKTAAPAAGKTAPAGTAKPEARIAASVPPAPPPKREAAPLQPAHPPAQIPPAPQGPLLDHKPTIVIDPGHGGADPGAQASDGTKEKDVVLNAALALAKKLEKSGRYTVVLTRATDATLKLRERVEIARASHGDLLISLHANLFEKSPAVSGLSIYTLSDKASDAAAAALARTENRADILAGIDLSNEDDDVTHILIDLAQHETLNRSVQFAHRVADSVSAMTPLYKNAAQQASLVVLKAPDVPSILVELGYLTNAGDLERMKSDAWLDQFADAVVTAADIQFQLRDTRRVERAALP